MARNKDIQILVKLATQGNFDEAQKQLERLKSAQAQGAASGVESVGKLSSAWKAWTAAATTSAGAMRKAWLAALGPISILIVAFQTLKSLLGFVITGYQNYKKAQEETNKSVREASDALKQATDNKNKYANAKGVDELNAAMKAHRADLDAISKKQDEIREKTKGAGQQWWNVFGAILANNRALMDQIPALAQAEIEMKKEIRAKEEALELTRQQEAAEKKRAAAAEEISKRVEELTLGETELKLANLDRQLRKYEEAGISAVDLEKLRALETAKILEDSTRKKEEEAYRQARTVEQIELELDQKLAAMDNDSLGQKQAALDAEYAARKAKIEKEVKDEKAKNKLLEKAGKEYLAAQGAITKAELKMKGAAALQIADLSIQALTVINSMSELKTKEDARRAKFLLALEKGIAIARAIAAAQSAGPMAAGIAAAQIGLITAQFAKEYKAIDQAQKASAAGARELTIQTPLPGGDTLNETISSAAPSMGGGGSTPSGATPGGGSVGGGNTVINVGPVNVYFDAQHVDLSEVNAIARRLGDEVRRGTTEAAKMARLIYNAGASSSGLAA